MSWKERLKKAIYISPIGFFIEFLYEDVSREFNKKTSAHEFPKVNGTYVQDFGYTGRQYPIRAFFGGDDCDKQALRFETELRENGIGRLEHPIYGTRNVIPFGKISRRDDLKTAANQSVVEVIFYETIWKLYAGSLSDLESAILKGLSIFNDAASGQLNAEMIVGTIGETSAFKNFYGQLTNSGIKGLGEIAGTQTDVKNQFVQTGQSMTKDLESGANPDVQTLGLQTTTLLQTPAKTTRASVFDKIAAYTNLILPLLIDDTIVSSARDARIDNEFHARDMYAATYISGMILAAINAIFKTKPEALSVVDRLTFLFDEWVEWREKNYEVLDKEDTGGRYAALQEILAQTSGYLVQSSFTLKIEKTIVLTRAYNVLELVAKLYGTVDEDLDFFINSNKLTGSEILEIPRGREIVYYV